MNSSSAEFWIEENVEVTCLPSKMELAEMLGIFFKIELICNICDSFHSSVTGIACLELYIRPISTPLY